MSQENHLTIEKPKVNFTKNQIDVIENLKGPVLVVACPGSGKTTTVIARANHLIENGVNPENILIITYSTAAATEMKKRFEEKYHRNDIDFRTIHSFCLKVLRSTSAYKNIGVLDPLGQTITIDRIIRERYKIEDQYVRADIVKRVIRDISSVINSDGTFENLRHPIMYDYRPINLGSVYEEYKAYKENNNCIDFDDMLIACRQIFLEEPQALEMWQEQAQYIIIDEFQDTNIVQANIFYMLASKYRNICVVGDDDQSIYMFRSADPKLMLGFGNDFPDYQQFYLDTNYRSDPKIIEHANLLISNNSIRYDKEFKPGSKDARKCIISRKDYLKKFSYEYNPNEDTPYEKMLKDLKQDINELYEMGIPYEEMAILYRINKQSQPIMHFFEKNKIPFHAIKADGARDIHTEFFFSCIVDYYRFLKKPDMEIFKNIVNIPNRFIPHSVINKSDMTEDGMILACKKHYENDYAKSRRCESRISLFFYTLEKLRKRKKPIDFVDCIYNDSNFKEWALKEARKNNGMDYTEDMLENCLNTIRQEAEEYETMEEWIDAANQNMESVTARLSSGEGITLSTYHGAKGLEWDAVFLIDVNDNITPSPLAENMDELEEERRMFYVAFTRARKHERIYVTDNPSPYLNEMKIDRRYHYDSERKAIVEETKKEVKKIQAAEQKIEPVYRNNLYKEKRFQGKGKSKNKPKAKKKN